MVRKVFNRERNKNRKNKYIEPIYDNLDYTTGVIYKQWLIYMHENNKTSIDELIPKLMPQCFPIEVCKIVFNYSIYIKKLLGLCNGWRCSKPMEHYRYIFLIKGEWYDSNRRSINTKENNYCYKCHHDSDTDDDYNYGRYICYY